MPTYEYECKKCGHAFEEFQQMKDDALIDCPQPRCKGKLRKLLSGGAGLIFKGSGFYQTDYKNSKSVESAKNNKAETEKKETTATDTSTKTETKKETPKKKETAKAKS